MEEKEQLNWTCVKRVKTVQCVAPAIAYLHHDCSLPIVHRDMMLNNILLESDFEPQLLVFGTVRLLNLDSSNWIPVAGSYGYMVPGKLAHAYTIVEGNVLEKISNEIKSRQRGCTSTSTSKYFAKDGVENKASK
ncbi:probable leucine-rich repeat receptor-like protein kinase At1g35710 [Eucalyptus grandis]|uniref:probable leucine-rich repeat receptor-like protein kinase At1g35710 n=1 Tax=Eucalyptus grandis TaxID=71139 RepID=UPI00192E7BA2|nr:probable leucine-rich repeat receptor-like protein kinase At1g35710 [Eucalyptus grandis]